MQKSFVLVRILFLGGLCISCSAEKELSFSKDIHPIFQENCMPCHKAGGIGEVASGFNVESYDNLMKGTRLGPVVQPGLSYASTLQVLVEHKANDKINMPMGRTPLAIEEIEKIGKWIDQGAKHN